MNFKTSYKIAAGIILLLIAIRIALPYLVEDYVNRTLNALPGHSGHVDDIDLSLYRGAYRIEGLLLKEDGGNPKHPFLQLPETNLSIEWRALFKGKLVGEIILDNPQLSIVERKEDPKPAETPTTEHWSQTVRDLMPFTVNRFVVNNGQLNYLDFTRKPSIDLHIHNMQLTALNLANVEEAGKELPSTVRVTGTSVGGGALKGSMKANLLQEIPDFDMDAQLTNVDLTSINDFIKAYGKFDVERGSMALYSELKLKDGQLDGYVKPFFENVKVLNWEKDKEEDGIFRAAWEAVAGLFTEVAENQPRDQIATKVPIEGNIKQPDTDATTTFLNILRHAFIKAFNKGIEAEAIAGGEEEK